jgi:hypothetical protein
MFFLRTVFLLAFLLFPLLSQASFDPPPAIGSRAISLGHAYTGIRSDFWSLFHNPAGLAGLQRMSFGAHVEQRFGLQELRRAHAGLAVPLWKGQQALGVDVSSFGFAAYRENRLGLAYALELMPGVSLGAKVNYAALSIPGYGNQGNLYVDLGVNTQISEQLSLGFSAFNVNRAKLGPDPSAEPLPTVVRTGLAYQPSSKLLLVTDLVKDLEHPLSVRLGVEYQLNDYLVTRLGMSTEPLSWQAGVGLRVKKLALDFAFGYTELLGFSPHLSLSLSLSKPSQEDE